MATNYAAILGIQNRWAPILFAVLYFLIMLWYLAQTLRRRATVYAGLAFFAALRVIAFSLRAAMASNHRNAAFNRKMAIAYEILYNVGFFSLLLSAHRLLTDRRRLAKINAVREKGRSALHRTMGSCHRGRFVELLLLVSVILGAVGISLALGTNAGRTRVGNSLNDASTYIFLAVAVIALISTLLIIRMERSLVGRGAGPAATSPSPLGSSLHHLIMAIIATLILLRILFYAVTVHQRATGQPTPTQQAASSVKQTAQGNEHLWYPLAALAELFAVLLFLTPALVPLRSLLARHRQGGGYGNEKAGYAGGDAGARGGPVVGGTTHDGIGHNGVGTVGTAHNGPNVV